MASNSFRRKANRPPSAMSAPQQSEPSCVNDRRYAVWNLYNEKAKTRDKELLKDWDYSINSLLLFAAIFASVLTSLCVESRKLLEQDPLDVLQRTVTYIADRDVNSSAILPSTTFRPEAWAIAVNGYFFASLASSILAAIGAVMCLQWVGEYDAGLEAASTPEQRALRAHYRYRATKQWYMHQLIAALPILLYISVALFFVGLAIWFKHVYPSLALIPIVSLLVGIFGYLITTILTVLCPSAPYRTSMSRLLFRVFWLLHFYIWYAFQSIRVLWRPFIKFIIDSMRDFIEQGCTFLRNLTLDLKTVKGKVKQYHNTFIEERAKYKREMKIRRAQAYPWIHPSRDHWQSMHSRLRELGSVIRDHTLHLSALTWLANSVHLSVHSKDAFKKLLVELNDMDEHRLREWSAYNHDAPWSHIFNLVLVPNAYEIFPPSTSQTAALPETNTSSIAIQDAPTPTPGHSRTTSGVSGTTVSQTTLMANLARQSNGSAAAKHIRDPEAERVPSVPSDHDMVKVISQLLRKMSDHPELFERTISRTSDQLIQPFMKEMSAHPPYDAHQAKKQLKCITALFSSRRWQRMDPSIQPCCSALKIILSCLEARDGCADDGISTSWLFTLCYVDHNTDAASWPHPEFVSVTPYAFRHEFHRCRVVEHYIDYIDTLLSGSELPASGNRRWRWRTEPDTQSEEWRIIAVQILAEHLLRRLDPNEIISIHERCQSHVRSPAIWVVLDAYAQPTTPVELLKSGDSQKDLSLVYALCFACGLRVKWSDKARHGVEGLRHDSQEVLKDVMKLNNALLNNMLEELIMDHIRLMTSGHWITILENLDLQERCKDLSQYASWMIRLAPKDWLEVFLNFFKQLPNSSCDSIVSVLILTLEGRLPHKIAYQRWRAAVERLSERPAGPIEGFRRVVDIVWKQSHLANTKGPLVISPLPPLLECILNNLRNIAHRERTLDEVWMYVKIVDSLVSKYFEFESCDQEFATKFSRIWEELNRIRPMLNEGDNPEIIHQEDDLQIFDRLLESTQPNRFDRLLEQTCKRYPNTPASTEALMAQQNSFVLPQFSHWFTRAVQGEERVRDPRGVV